MEIGNRLKSSSFASFLFALNIKLAAYTSTTVPYTNYYYVNTMAAPENDVVDFMYDMVLVECNASMSVR